MNTIDLKNKTHVNQGTIESYWFENENIGLKNTLFHRITLPLQEFDSGIEYEEQPVNTEIVLEWYALGLKDPTKLDGLNLSHKNFPNAEASVYLGSAHNWCNVLELEVSEKGPLVFELKGRINIEFENERVAQNELFEFVATAHYIDE